MENNGINETLYGTSESKKKRNARKKIIHGRIPFVPLSIIVICLIILLLLNTYDSLIYVNLFKDLVIAILASFIFVFILNIKPPMQINDQLIIRHEESEEKHPLTLSLMVGNTCRKLIGGLFDLKFTFIYCINDGAKSNMAKAKSVERRFIYNYYRASIELEDMDEIEKSFWKDYITLEPSENHNSIFVIISGSSNRFGNNFRYLVKYPIECILIGEDCIGALDKETNSSVDIFHGKLKPEFDESMRDPYSFYWEAFNLFYPYISEYKNEEEQIIKEIQQNIEQE